MTAGMYACTHTLHSQPLSLSDKGEQNSITQALCLPDTHTPDEKWGHSQQQLYGEWCLHLGDPANHKQGQEWEQVANVLAHFLQPPHTQVITYGIWNTE